MMQHGYIEENNEPTINVTRKITKPVQYRGKKSTCTTSI